MFPIIRPGKSLSPSCPPLREAAGIDAPNGSASTGRWAHPLAYSTAWKAFPMVVDPVGASALDRTDARSKKSRLKHF
jgi:hypothetical protein